MTAMTETSIDVGNPMGKLIEFVVMLVYLGLISYTGDKDKT